MGAALAVAILLGSGYGASTSFASEPSHHHGGHHHSYSRYTAKTVANPNRGRASSQLVRERTALAVYEQHIKALNACDWHAILAQYPDQAQIFFPAAVTIAGRDQIADLFAGFVKPHSQGGLCGITFTEEHRQITGNTLSVQWVANADFLAEPYRGSDAYITDDGLMVSMVSTFDSAQLKFTS